MTSCEREASADPPGSRSRREATAVTEGDLTKSQKLAIERIARALNTALTDLETFIGGAESKLPKADGGRTNQTFFVSGEPGSGKTSIHLSLREFLTPRGKQDLRELPNTEKLRDGAGRIAWLEPLDLESGAGSTNFLAAVLVRIAHVLRPESTEAWRRRPSFLEDEPVDQNLARVQNDMVLAWDGVHPERARNVDPEVLVQEALRVEQASLRVNEELEKTLRWFSSSSGEATLLVLPVDDFYLKPEASVEFLRLLRMISVPELFIILTGDLDVINDLLYQDRLGLLVKRAGEMLRTESSDTAALSARARALTSQALRKLIPMAQRTVLEFMTSKEALAFTPNRCKDQSNDVEELLQRIPLKAQKGTVRNPPTNLAEFLCASEASEDPDRLYVYSGLGILDLPPREVADLWHTLAELSPIAEEEEDKYWPDRVLKFVMDQARMSLDHDAMLDQAGKDACWLAVDGMYSHPVFHPAELHLSAKTGRYQTIWIDGSTALVVREHGSWVIGPARTEALDSADGADGEAGRGDARLDGGLGSAEPAPSRTLAPRPAAWFTVLHDLMVLWNRVDLPPRDDRGAPESILSAPLRWASFRWRLPPGSHHLSEEDKRQYRLCGRAGEPQWLELDWPLPPWLELRQFDLLGFQWNKTLEDFDNRARPNTHQESGPASGQRADSSGQAEDAPSGTSNPVAWLAFHWIDQIRLQLMGNEPSDAQKKRGKDEPGKEEPGKEDTRWNIQSEDWTTLTNDITKLRSLFQSRPLGHQRRYDVERSVADDDQVAEAWAQRLERLLGCQLVKNAFGHETILEQLLGALRGPPPQPAGPAEEVRAAER